MQELEQPHSSHIIHGTETLTQGPQGWLGTISSLPGLLTTCFLSLSPSFQQESLEGTQ